MSRIHQPAPRATIGFLERHRGVGTGITLLVLVVVGASTGALTGTAISRVIGAALAGIGAGP